MSSDGWTPSKILAGGITLGVVLGKMALPYVRSFLNTKMLQAAAWKLLLQPARKAFTDAGFVARTALLPTGEEVPYLERPAAATGMPTQRTIVLLHGITTDATGLAFAIEPLTAALGPDVRLLAPDAPGHGASRSQWVQHVDLIGNSMWRGFDRDAHVSDLEAFLVAAVACRGPRTRERLARAQRGAAHSTFLCSLARGRRWRARSTSWASAWAAPPRCSTRRGGRAACGGSRCSRPPQCSASTRTNSRCASTATRRRSTSAPRRRRLGAGLAAQRRRRRRSRSSRSSA